MITTGLIVCGGIVLAGVLALTITAFGAEKPLANPPLGIAAPVDFANLSRNADIAGLERGRSYYAQLCLPCHGARGDGLGEWAYRVHPRPADLTSQRMRGRSEEQLYEAISEGFAGTPMKGWKDRLSDMQLRQIILYVRHLGVIAAVQ